MILNSLIDVMVHMGQHFMLISLSPQKRENRCDILGAHGQKLSALWCSGYSGYGCGCNQRSFIWLCVRITGITFFNLTL